MKKGDLVFSKIIIILIGIAVILTMIALGANWAEQGERMAEGIGRWWSFR